MIFNFEKKILEWAHKHVLLIGVIVLTIISICIRYSFREIISNDSYWCLIPWYEIIKSNGGLAGLKTQVGNYNLLYQTIIAIFTYFPIEPLNAYKLLSGVFDYLCAGAIGWFIYENVETADENKKRLIGAMAYCAVIYSPLVFLNSSYWGQCDAMYSFFCLASLFSLCKEKYTKAFVLFGIAFALKLQAVFFLPVLLFVYFVKKKFSCLYFLFLPVILLISGIPAAIAGRKITDVFTIYLGQTDFYRTISMNYPSFWNILQDKFKDQFYLDFKRPAMAIAIAVLAIYMIVWAKRKLELTNRNLVFISFIMVYTCVLFLPAMHERYGFIYELLALIIVFYDLRTLPLLVAMYYVDCTTYGFYLFERTENMTLLSLVNTTVYIGYVAYLMYVMLKENRGKIRELSE